MKLTKTYCTFDRNHASIVEVFITKEKANVLTKKREKEFKAFIKGLTTYSRYETLTLEEAIDRIKDDVRDTIASEDASY
jgi:hypothetical protein